MLKKEKTMNLENELNKNSAIDFAEGISNLITGIKKDYAKWSTWKRGIEEFNNGINIKTGKIKKLEIRYISLR